jgi:precorrin-3B synthase
VNGDRADHCPGVLRLHDALDGKLARIRLPGGLVTADQLGALSAAAVDLGDGRLELTSRGNVQLRGMSASAAAELVDRLTDVGLAPSPTHELVRNIVASPLAGLAGGPDLRPIVRALDAAICAAPRLADLSGRFLFAIDDGRGDVASMNPDVLAVVMGDEAELAGRRVPVAELPEAMVHAARVLLDGSATAERTESSYAPAATTLHLIGRVGPALIVAAPLGRLTATQARWLADNSPELRITPWRRVVLPVAPDADPADVGFVTDADSPWLLVSACAGRPRCSKALADVQADAAAALDRFPGRRVHWSGCDRRCGRTTDIEVDVIATPEGYVVHE